MTFHIDKRTLLFDDLTVVEAMELIDKSYYAQIHGVVDMEHPAFKELLRVYPTSDDNHLLYYSTLFLTRAGLSAAMFFKNKYQNME